MVKLYIMKIHRGEIAIDDVPALWRDKVVAELAREGFESFESEAEATHNS